MNKFLKIILIILAFLVLLVAIYFFAKGLTGSVVYDNNNTEDRNNFVGNENRTIDRNINNYNVTNKTPEELNEGECVIMQDGRKLCMVKRGAKVNAGEVTDESGNI